MKRIAILIAIFLASVPSLAHNGDRVSADDVYTLYRSSVLDSTMRIHIATFDASDGADYNEENCAIARDLFRTQPGVTVAYWCERGYVSITD